MDGEARVNDVMPICIVVAGFDVAIRLRCSVLTDGSTIRG
jgi:hypothetical protein